MNATTLTVRPGPAGLRHTWRVPVVGLSAACLGAVALIVRDPHHAGTWGMCPVNSLTGGFCPGCGSLRGLHDLLVGQPIEAVGHNLLLLPALAWLGWWWLAATAAAWGRRLTGPPSSARFCYGLLLVLVAFTVARNLPGSPLAP